MAVTVPDWADTMLDVIGINWPNVDEDAYRDMADALREFAEDVEDDRSPCQPTRATFAVFR
ncbi:hypothetical protein SMICM17S_01619 [Streptomyces microflavus]